MSEYPTVSSAPTLEVECIELTITFDQFPYDTYWDIVIGEESSVSSNATIISSSPYYDFSNASSTVNHVICLPRDRYTFTIMDYSSNGLCCDYGTGGYIITLRDQPNNSIAQGGDFGFADSITFDIPYTTPPSAGPTQSHQPTISLVPTNTCTLIDISITFDSFPDETSWMVVVGAFDPLGDNDGAVIVAESPYYDPAIYTSSSETVSICLPGDGEYSFIIYDSSWDGMCCRFGNGGFVVSSSDGDIISQGGEFQDRIITTFNIPFAAAPSISPSVSTQPTTSISPTKDCNMIEVSLTFDSYPSEVQWLITEGKQNSMNTSDVVFESPFYDNNNFGVTISEKMCLPDGIFTFTIADQAGDGICCGTAGNGKYVVTFLGDTDQVIVEGGDFGYYESVSASI